MTVLPSPRRTNGRRRYDEAIAAHQHAISIAPSAQSYSNIASIEYFRGRYDEAARAYARRSHAYGRRWSPLTETDDAIIRRP